MSKIVKCLHDEKYFLNLSYGKIRHRISVGTLNSSLSVSVSNEMLEEIRNSIDLFLNPLSPSESEDLKNRTTVYTNKDFYEWAVNEENISEGIEYIGQHLYNKFTTDNPDFGPRGKCHLTLIKFYKYLDLFGIFKYGQKPVVNRTAIGKQYIFRKKHNDITKFKL